MNRSLVELESILTTQLQRIGSPPPKFNDCVKYAAFPPHNINYSCSFVLKDV